MMKNEVDVSETKPVYLKYFWLQIVAILLLDLPGFVSYEESASDR